MNLIYIISISEALIEVNEEKKENVKANFTINIKEITNVNLII